MKKDNRNTSESINNEDYNIEDTVKLMTPGGFADGKKKLVIITAAALAAVILIGAFGIRALGEKRYDDQIAIAEKAYFEGDYSQAETEYLKAVDMNKRKTTAREGLAYVYAVEGKFDQAGEIYTELYEETGDEKYLTAIIDSENEQRTGDPELIIGGVSWRQSEPAPEVTTEMNEEMKEELTDFLMYLRGYRKASSEYGKDDLYDYDFSDAANCGILNSIMGDMAIYGFLETYSGTGYEWHNTFDGPDPLEKGADTQMWAGYHSADAERVNWIASNIFNASEEEINKELEHASGLSKMENLEMPLYLHEGKYYRLEGYKGGFNCDISFEDISVDGDYFIVTYTENQFMIEGEYFEHIPFRARMQYKIIEGKGYWSLYTREKV